MPPCAIVEDDIAKVETTKELHSQSALVVIGDVKTVFSRRHDAAGADGTHINSKDGKILLNLQKPPYRQHLQSFKTPVKPESE